MRNGLFSLNRLFLAIFWGFSWMMVARAVGDGLRDERWVCAQSSAFFARTDNDHQRRYAPDREVRIRHIELDITPDFKRRTIVGQAKIQFQPNLKPVTEFTLDAVDLVIQSVTSTETIQAWQATEGKVTITFAAPIPADRIGTVTLVYSAEPSRGIYFRTPEMGYKESDTHLFSQGEAVDSRYWYPIFDAPNEKLTSEVTCRVPEGMTVISNGRLVSQDRDPASGLVAFHWSQELPHANYLITLVAGYFKKLEDQHRNVPLAFWTPPSEIQAAATSFRDSKDIMEFLETETGTPYPWAKYDQICVNDFVEGGMENTSATTLTDGTLFTEATENIHNSEALISHEMAHQWFGDLVTCKDWSDIWLNEGFATYYELLYDGHKNGRDSMLYGLFHNAQNILGQSNDTNAIVRNNYGTPMSVFSYLAYPKGGWVLHMLRSQLGEDLYRRCIQTYLSRHKFKNVQTEDLRVVIHELSGRSFESFFDQWLYHAHHPELEVESHWDEKTKLAKISVRQVQSLSSAVLLFDFPITVRFKGKFGTVDRPIQIKEKEADFYFPLESAPEVVRLDPNYTLLAKIHFEPDRAMCRAQLADKDDMIGRLLAVEKLATEKDHDAIALLKQTLNNDAFYGVRMEAAQALGGIHSDEAFEALLASTHQPDARVRNQVVGILVGFYREAAYAAALETLAHEKNPEIVASAIAGIAPYPNAEVHNLLIRYLDTESFRDRLTDAAIDAMRLQDDPSYLMPLLARLQKTGAELTTPVFCRGLDALAYLARNEEKEKKDPVREFLVGQVNAKKERVQLAALSALGTLGDPKALPVLETFAKAAKESRQRQHAEKSVATLRATRKPVDDFKNLREEVLALQKEGRELRRQLDELKKKIEAEKSRTEPGVKPSAEKKSSDSNTL